VSYILGGLTGLVALAGDIRKYWVYVLKNIKHTKEQAVC